MGIYHSKNQYLTPANKYPKKLMTTFNNMKQRCKRHPHYKNINICQEWSGDNGAINFYEWSLSNGYKEGLSIDRIDNSLGYSPENCRWIPRTLQLKNRDIVKNKGELHHIEILPSGKFRVTTSSRRGRVRNIFTTRAEAISYRDKKVREEEEYAWHSYQR